MRDRSIRASDADRERVARVLRDHAVVGRLPGGPRRAHRPAFGARTLGELDALLSDLPNERRYGRRRLWRSSCCWRKAPAGCCRRRHRDDRGTPGARRSGARARVLVAAARHCDEPERCAQVRKSHRLRAPRTRRREWSECMKGARATSHRRRGKRDPRVCGPTIVSRRSSTGLPSTSVCASTCLDCRPCRLPRRRSA